MQTIRINSSANPLIRKLTALHDARGIRRHNAYLAGGPRLVREALTGFPGMIDALITHDGLPAPLEIPPSVRCVVLSAALFNRVNCFGTPGALLLMRRPQPAVFDPAAPWPPGCTLFVPFGNPDNVGSVIRSAAAMGAARVVLTAEAACPFLPRALRASAGALWRIPLENAGELDRLPLPSDRLYVLDAGGQPLSPATLPRGAYGLLAGREGPGLPAAAFSGARRIAIPMHQGVESLNAAVAVAVTLWAARAAAGPA